MKYSEFEKLMEDKGFYIEPDSHDVLVCGEDDLVITSISKSHTFALHTDYTSFMVLDEHLRIYVAKMSIELAFTALEDREEVAIYYLRQKGIGSWSFLNFNIDTQEYTVAGKKDDYTYKTQFTQSEIDDMPECYTHPAVWEKIKVDREWSEMD